MDNIYRYLLVLTLFD